jgi:hypothetical protein
VRACVGDARDRRKLATRDRGGHADLAHAGSVDLRLGAFGGADLVDLSNGSDIVGEAQLHCLGAVSDRAAADGDDEIGVRCARGFACGDHGLAWRVLRHRIEDAHAARSERRLNLVDLVGLAPQRAGDHQEGAEGREPVHLRDNSLGRRLAEHDLVHGAENDTPFVHTVLPGLLALLLGTD